MGGYDGNRWGDGTEKGGYIVDGFTNEEFCQMQILEAIG